VRKQQLLMVLRQGLVRGVRASQAPALQSSAWHRVVREVHLMQ